MHRVIELEFTESFLDQIEATEEERPLDDSNADEDAKVSIVLLLLACQAGGNVVPDDEPVLANCDADCSLFVGGFGIDEADPSVTLERDIAACLSSESESGLLPFSRPLIGLITTRIGLR